MKQIIPILILILISSCQENKTKESETLKVESKIETIEQVKQETEKRLTTDTLQYLEEGENEDNLYAVFLTKELETITIVLSENEDLENMEKNTM